jgi:hypothetical protein
VKPHAWATPIFRDELDAGGLGPVLGASSAIGQGVPPPPESELPPHVGEPSLAHQNAESAAKWNYLAMRNVLHAECTAGDLDAVENFIRIGREQGEGRALYRSMTPAHKCCDKQSVVALQRWLVDEGTLARAREHLPFSFPQPHPRRVTVREFDAGRLKGAADGSEGCAPRLGIFILELPDADDADLCGIREPFLAPFEQPARCAALCRGHCAATIALQAFSVNSIGNSLMYW